MKLKSVFVYLLTLLFLNLNDTYAQADHIGTAYKFPGHPRILMLAGEEAVIKNTIAKDKTWGNVHQAILAESDKIVSLPPVERILTGRRLLGKSREALRRLFFLSYSYRTTAKNEYLKRAEKELLAISAFSDWNPSHFLDVGEMTMAAAIGYDWLHAKLPEATRNIVREAILKKGLEPSFNPKHNSWLKAEHNWNQVCNAGMTYGAMAIYEDEPVIAKQIINRAIESMVLPMKDYSPDGAYPEGYGYWGYGTSFNVMFISAIEKLFGKDFGLSEMPGFLKTASYMENMTGPSSKPFNYSDAGSNGGIHPAMFWFANKIKDPSVLWVEKNYLTKISRESLVNDRLLPAIMLWSGGISIDKITPPESTVWLGKGKVPVAMMRTNWTDSNAVYVGLKGGSVSVNHAHMDIGSFIMEADGQRWAMDFGMQDYESLESKGIQLFGRTQDAQRWTVFRLTNLVHNTLTIDNQHQDVKGFAPITAWGERRGFKNAVTDMTEVYKGQVAKAVRGIAIVDESYVLVRDEIESLNKETTIRWTMLTPANVKIIGSHKAELSKNGKTLMLQVKGSGKIKMQTWSTDPPNSYDAPNPGTTLVGFTVTLPANSKTAFDVSLVPGSHGKKKIKKTAALDMWNGK
ncbi:heparinase II/III family protein [Daejeonella sp.]|uniref:heparinase II/III domain-containing protein n=1 Tax=Daejeonella sp. TaxID=2805397 RepID=UPI0030C323BE